MTGELSDVFATREEGVAYLVTAMQNAIGTQRLSIYAGSAGFLAPDLAGIRPLYVASANWHASAVLAATYCPDGLLVDFGTTTTDLVPLRAGAPASRGVTDGERLAEGELVYTGVVRTPVMAVAREAPARAARRGSPPSASPPWPTSIVSPENCRTMRTPTRRPITAEEHRRERGAACAHARPRRERG